MGVTEVSGVGRQLARDLEEIKGFPYRIVEMKSFLIVLAVCIVVTQEAFCPGEKKYGKRCLAKPNAYKCGVFFEDLTPKKPITWLGALPDALKQISKKRSQKVLGEDITSESFSNFYCDDVAANARCYTTLNEHIWGPLDSCPFSNLYGILPNSKVSGTVGDKLCGQVKRWLKNDDDFKANGRRDINIVYYYSSCESDWAPVTDGLDRVLAHREKLCCTKDGLFERCDGTDFRKSCKRKL